MQIFVDDGQPVTHQTRNKIKSSLQVRNTCNIQDSNQRKKCRLHPSRIYTKNELKLNTHENEEKLVIGNSHQNNKPVEN